jgi:hypothetical protein
MKLTRKQLKGVSDITLPKLKAFLKEFSVSMQEIFKQYIVDEKTTNETEGGKKSE